MSASVLSVRVDSDIKASFSDLCDELGLSPSAAVNVFIRQMLREKSFPFVPSAASSASASRSVLTLSQIKSCVENVVLQRPEIASVILFGSYARGEADGTSDVDLRINLAEGSKMGAIALASLSEELRQALGKPVDVVTAKYLRDDLRVAIETEGVVIYERA